MTIKICEQCGEEYEAGSRRQDKRRFCSRKCMGEWRSKNWCGKNHPTWKGVKIIKICEQCGKEYEIKPSVEKRSRFCSRKCVNIWLSENSRDDNNASWKGGISFEPYCPKFNKPFKESVREKFGRVCFLCPTTEEENGEKLSVHHVNYNKDCLCDDSVCEFVPLCNKCHSKTNHNRDYWENMIMQKLTALQW